MPARQDSSRGVIDMPCSISSLGCTTTSCPGSTPASTCAIRPPSWGRTRPVTVDSGQNQATGTWFPGGGVTLVVRKVGGGSGRRSNGKCRSVVLGRIFAPYGLVAVALARRCRDEERRLTINPPRAAGLNESELPTLARPSRFDILTFRRFDVSSRSAGRVRGGCVGVFGGQPGRSAAADPARSDTDH